MLFNIYLIVGFITFAFFVGLCIIGLLNIEKAPQLKEELNQTSLIKIIYGVICMFALSLCWPLILIWTGVVIIKENKE